MRLTIAGIALAASLAGGVARAAEVVEFADGRYLEVRSHAVVGAAIRLEFREGSYLELPAERVDEIQRERRVVYRKPGQRDPRAVESAGGSAASAPSEVARGLPSERAPSAR